ncbi:MAG: right-handed parallel beta-helix repeat-containing protein [Thermoanaerobaculia bacterium]|nr:right-handed parallel beta-helix repeat-containing protein [Thermoanaerobaculia bacterium]
MAPARAATFAVNRLYDAVDLSLDDGECDVSASPDNQCTLRAAVQQARATAEGDTIFLPAGTLTLSILGANESWAATGDLDLWGDVEILGSLDAPGSIIQAVDGWDDRLFETYLPAASEIRFWNLEMRGGNANWGGALFLNADYVTVEDCVLTGNQATDGGAIYNASSELTLVRSTLLANHAANRGGGLYDGGLGWNTIDRSLIAQNTAGGNGGGLFIASDLVMTNSTVSGNLTNGSGGGFQVFDGQIELRNVTIVTNAANFDGEGNGAGGGLNLSDGTTTIRNSIVANNATFGFPEHNDCWGQLHTLVSAGATLVEKPCAAYDPSPSDLNGVDPELGPLAANGGPTLSHRPLPGSPVLDAGDAAVPGSDPDACEPIDQRGTVRPQEGTGFGVPRCDMGAVELEGYLFADSFESGNTALWN